ncbi:hypothetical protein FB451DRAFT_1170383 [Mycena latifolia]|nr:hypothetical protein FB451DRAFT_1170383 [Mycena latifolia]
MEWKSDTGTSSVYCSWSKQVHQVREGEKTLYRRYKPRWKPLESLDASEAKMEYQAIDTDAAGNNCTRHTTPAFLQEAAIAALRRRVGRRHSTRYAQGLLMNSWGGENENEEKQEETSQSTCATRSLETVVARAADRRRWEQSYKIVVQYLPMVKSITQTPRETRCTPPEQLEGASAFKISASGSISDYGRLASGRMRECNAVAVSAEGRADNRFNAGCGARAPRRRGLGAGKRS